MAAAGPSNAPPSADDDWVYNIPVPGAPPISDETAFPKEYLGDIENLPAYSILNGRPEDIQPYLLRGSIPEAVHWVPVNGINPRDAIKCVDGYIKSSLYQLTRHGGHDRNPNLNRTAAIILGTARAVITTNYEVRVHDLIPNETAAPVINARMEENGTVTYNSLLAANTPNGALVTTPLNLSAAEHTLVRVVMRSAQAIVPLQGLNLITEGHHYLSERSKSSFKAFAAVEKQVWMPPEFKTILTANEDAIRDLMWHKAGHPLAVSLKELAATSPKVKENLENAKLGSAVARLPALEADVRAAQTYQKVAEAVAPIWQMMGGSITADRIRVCLTVLERLPRGGPGLATAVTVAEGVTVRTRSEVLDILKRLVKANSDKVAFAFGFYCSMVEKGIAEGAAAGSDTLRRAFSLKKLINESAASFAMGQELFKDYQAVKKKQRIAGNLNVPDLVLDI